MVTIKKLVELLEKSGADIDFASVSSTKKLEDIGLDSLDIYNFFTEIDDEFGIEVPDEAFEQLDTLEKVKDYLEQELND